MKSKENEVRHEMPHAKNGDTTGPDAPPTVSRRELFAKAVRAVAGVMGGIGLMHLARIDSVVAWADSDDAKAVKKAIRRKAKHAISKSSVSGSVNYEEMQGKTVDSGIVETHALKPNYVQSNHPLCACAGCSCTYQGIPHATDHQNNSLKNATTPVQTITWGRLKALFK